MKLSIELQGFDALLKKMDDQHQLLRAAARAINRTVDGVATDISKEIRSTYNVRKDDVDRRIQKGKCGDYYDLVGSVTVVDEEKSRLPLILFNAMERRNLAKGSIKTKRGKSGFYSQKLSRKTSQEGVSYKVLKSGGKGLSRNAFIIPGGKGSLQVVRRLPGQKGRFALKEKRVVSIAAMAGNMSHGVIVRIKQAAEKRLSVNFERELKYYQSEFDRGFLPGGRRRRY